MSINYGFDQIQTITVDVQEYEYQKVIAEYARMLVQNDGKVNPVDWGFTVRLHEEMLSDYSGMRRWAEVIFHRHVTPESEKENE